jgi:SAM-dependent methyltransferase
MTDPAMTKTVSLPAPMNAFKYSVAWSSTCARSLARLALRPMRRTRGKVAEEYDAGRWTSVRTSADWQHETDLRRYLISDRERAMSGELIAKMAGAARRVRVHDYYQYRVEAFAGLLREYFDPADEVVELGCGYGYNLFSLAVSWPHTHLLGFDISPNAVEATRNIARHFGLTHRLEAELLDATDGNHPNFQKLRGRNLFTFFCIEQIPYDVSKVVTNILAQSPKRVVHAEPGTALLKRWKLRDWPDFFYLRSVDYQNELYDVLRTFEAQGKLRIIEARRMPFAPSLQNTGALIAWEPA